MRLSEIKAELSIKMLELEKAIDVGMPYSELKRIYNEVKELQYQIAFSWEAEKDIVAQNDSDLVIE